jgi:hypothetical protein
VTRREKEESDEEKGTEKVEGKGRGARAAHLTKAQWAGGQTEHRQLATRRIRHGEPSERCVGCSEGKQREIGEGRRDRIDWKGKGGEVGCVPFTCKWRSVRRGMEKTRGESRLEE